jgi:cysteine-rich repeat protein
MEMMYKIAPQCYKFHHSQSDCEICDIDFNFTCYTDCSERNEWDYDCKECEGTCYTCSGNDAFHCFSCYETDYRFHERCTCCPETCGDGRFIDDSEYDCDDGNNNNDDGCDQNCLYEAGFELILYGSYVQPSVLEEICGDGRKINHACDDANTDSGDG